MIDWSTLKVDALLVTALPNIRYLSGFTGSNALLLLTPSGQTLFTDPRYTIQASQESEGQAVIASGPLYPAALKTAKKLKVKHLGFERDRIGYSAFKALKGSIKLRPIGPVIEELRMIKRPDEIELIRASVATNSKAFDSTLKSIRPGIEEREVASELEYQMRHHGAERAAFETIVAAGARTALPHAQPTAHRLQPNELLLIDMGATQAGYASDMTRMVFLRKPGKKIRDMYTAVLDAQQHAIDSIREGITAGAVDQSARKVLAKHGLGEAFVHSTGHGLGLEIHEPPRLGKKDATRLKAGMTITIEPGAYIEGLGGIRIEDTVLVTKNGCEILTPTAKELKVL